MNREIKFRCWIKHYSIMYDWDLIIRKNKINLLTKQHPSCPIMQYTGLKDCNGVEIYEGDILSDIDNNLFWLVGFYDRGCFVAHNPKDALEYVMLDDYTFKVIGNIYENPELLTK